MTSCKLPLMGTKMGPRMLTQVLEEYWRALVDEAVHYDVGSTINQGGWRSVWSGGEDGDGIPDLNFKLSLMNSCP